jgi:serine-type D-Ala-D-Ala carboxypeptidase/endopeptidase (penicillin-binding protein 4)
MMRLLLLLLSFSVTSCAAASMRDAEMTKSFSGRNLVKPTGYHDTRALKDYVSRLTADGRNWRQHGVYVETLGGADPVAMLNETAEFNPASVIKLSTTLAALDKLGLEYRFRTEFRADGVINSQARELTGDLILLSGGDPSFSKANAEQVGDVLRKEGIQRVNGSLLVVGAFTCNENSSTRVSAEVFIKHSKLLFNKPTRYENFVQYVPRGRSLLTIESDTLLRIVQYLNAHSVNAMADMLASHIGGPQGVQKFLVEQIGMPKHSVYISHGSGLEVNRMTPRDTVKLLRAMMGWLEKRNLKLPAVMPVAGIDSGTLGGRFRDGQFAGSVVAKTGTLFTTDTGVAALAGVMYTRHRGPLLFAVYDTAEGKRVPQLRRLQDELLKNIMVECGGPASTARQGHKPVHSKPQSRMITAR